ncbi:armadillo repeat-containing protein 7 isoform X2 [Myzus persicae]|uniref:armadillo repeat-containing protein 7 isoform X2 n=1 Tax=Myzus persicae TaxID=13164 RepID=UPI000B9360EF|nr:armadillo repeat-containing protein 7 isoform X2 [Myzus persicae]XP_022160858.1 armadillo repeat-containing protein 7 isoform X2 [Myzus persicae]
MFHKPQDLLKRTPADGINRPEFLKQLVQEFRKTNSAESKLQVLANLANFAYDPVNYLHIRTQKVIDLFLEQLASDDNQLIAFAAAGLCNLVNDPANKDYIIGNGGIQNIEKNLSIDDDNIILSCITTLMYLYAPEIKTDIVNPSIVGCMLSHAESENPKLRNVAKIFLTDFCTEHDIQTAITSNT